MELGMACHVERTEKHVTSTADSNVALKRWEALFTFPIWNEWTQLWMAPSNANPDFRLVLNIVKSAWSKCVGFHLGLCSKESMLNRFFLLRPQTIRTTLCRGSQKYHVLVWK